MKLFSLFLLLTIATLEAQEKSAQELVDSKEKADMTYQQMMQIMNLSAGKIYNGIILQNKVMVKDGVKAIMYHRAPNHKPWLIMKNNNQEAFKKMLLLYDEELHEDAESISDAVDKNDWIEAINSFSKMTHSCIICHDSFKDKVVKREF
ncbi:MAG: hypothetical protein U9P38_03925 [Campylobacterota bacterium]|nr:hypothetical protein [Campylobacterota bacterium]